MNHDNLDERQLQLRSIAFQRAYVTLLLALVFSRILVALGVLQAVDILPCMALSVAVLYGQLILHQIYPGSETLQKRFFLVCLLLGLASAGLGLWHLLGPTAYTDSEPAANHLSLLFSGLMFLVPPVSYIVRKKTAKSEDEE